MLEKYMNKAMDISTHTLTWSVTFNRHIFIRIQGNFNSHAHVERDLQLTSEFLGSRQISTHTLTWSVTNWNGHNFVAKEISTHTLTWSVTNICGKLC